MASKIRHLLLRDGRYFARLVVPAELRRYVGKTEIRSPLGADRREAIRLHARALADLQDVLARARRAAELDGRTAPNAPTRPMPLGSIAHLHYSEALELDARARDIPREESGVSTVELNQRFASGRAAALRRVASGSATTAEVSAVVGWAIERLRDRGSFAAPHGSPQWRELARTLASVELEALARSLERDQGDYGGKPSYPPLTTPAPHEALANEISLSGLLESYLAELQQAGRGQSVATSWRPVMRHLVAFLGHDDAVKITRADLVRWRAKALESIAPTTFQMVWLAGVRAAFRWGVESEVLKENPALSVKMRLGRKIVTRDKGFSDAEALTILRAALNYKPSVQNETQHMRDAKTWIPWLCAFTGARVGEIVQLRKEDVLHDGSIRYLRLTPEAGTIKTGHFRDVPIHAQLIDLGFLDFIERSKDGPLFYRQGRDAQKSILFVSQRLGKWIRLLGVTDKGVAPNHAWRHRFKTIGRDLGIDARVIDAVQGHSPRTAGEAYGSVSLKAKAAAIEKFPSVEIRESDRRSTFAEMEKPGA